MTEAAASPTPAARKRAPAVRYVDSGGADVSIAAAQGIRVGAWTYLLPADGSARLFALAGMAALALPIAKKHDAIGADPTATLAQRFAAVTPSAWGDEKSARAKPDPEARKRAALDELVDVVRTCKQAAGLPFDEAGVRAKLADPAFARKARKEPHIAAEIARRAGASAPPPANTLAGL